MPDLGRLSPQELLELRTLYHQAEMAELRYKHYIQLCLVARNYGLSVGINMATGKFEER